MHFNFKKIASAASSALMIGSTVALAAAANYPMPFVSGSSADVAIVVGDNASADLTAAAALSADLSTRFAANGGRTTTTATTTGEVFPLFTSSSEIYLNDSITAGARTTITDDDLAEVLSDGDFSGNVDAEYSQTINLNGASRALFDQAPDTDADPTVYISLGTSAGTHIYNSTIVFNKAVNFTHADSQGETLTLFGKEWTVGADTTSTELVLYKSSEKVSLSLGGATPTPSRTVEVDGEMYTVELVSASDTDATIRITDSSGSSDSDEINEDQSKRINGIEVAVTNTNENEALGQVTAEVTVGSDKITLEDGQNVEVGTDDDSIEGSTVDFVDTTITGNITQIRIQTYAEDTSSDAIVAGSSFVDPVWGSFKVDFTGLNAPLDSTSDREMIELAHSGDDRMKFTLTDHSDNAATIEWLNNESQTMRLAYGDRAENVIKVVERVALNESMRLIVGNEDEGHLLELTQVINSTSGNQYENDRVEFTDVFSGKKTSATLTSDGAGTITIGGRTYDVSYSGVQSNPAGVTVRLNYPDSSSNGVVLFPTIETSKGAKFALYEPVTINLDNFDGAGGDVSSFEFPDGDGYTSVSVTLGTGGNFSIGGLNVNSTGVTAQNATVGRLTYSFTYSSGNTTVVRLVDPVAGSNIVLPAFVMFEEQEDRTDTYDALVATVTGGGVSNNEDEINTVASSRGINGAGSSSYTSVESSDGDLTQLLTYYGSLVTRDDSSDQRTVTISYPDDQVQAMIYVAEGEATVGSGSSGALGDIVYDASEVSSVSNKNLIVLGGSCINTVAAQLLGGSAPLCGADFTARTQVGSGSFLIQSFTSPWNSNKVALLVAGYEAQDTINAANALKSNSVDTSVGKKYTGTTATSLTPVL